MSSMEDAPPPPPPARSMFFRSTEAARVRSVLRYLHAWRKTFQPLHLDRPAFPHDANRDANAAESCKDPALAAFAQLGALRLHARRCLISLLASTVEYVLVESTRSLSLQYDTTEDMFDDIWIGTSSFLREEGINGSVLHQWQKARSMRVTPDADDYYYRQGSSGHWCIHSDLAEESKFQDLPFMQRGLRNRFFFSVPLRDPQGGVIGAFSIIDDKPRYGVSAGEMAFAEEMADTVVRHLDSTVARIARQRSERLIHGLSLFNQGKWSLREWWLLQENEGSRRGGRHYEHTSKSGVKQQERADEEFGSVGHDTTYASSRKSSVPDDEATEFGDTHGGSEPGFEGPVVITRDFAIPPAIDAQEDADVMESRNTTAPEHADEVLRQRANSESLDDLSKGLRRTYAHASNLMREALGAEGVLVVDAASVGSKAIGTDGRTSESQSHSNEGLTHSESDTSDAERSTSSCEVLGFSSRLLSSLSESQAWRKYKIRRNRLARLIQNHPTGTIFNLAENGTPYSSSGGEQSSTADSERSTSRQKPVTRKQRDGKYLGGVFLGARSIAFYPLRSSDRWQSCIIVWSTDMDRFFDQTEDLAYLAAFGHSLYSRTSKLEAAAASQAKGSFISTISHELRSPLHGVLAGTELLQGSELTSFQQEMTHMITIAARTLLDTVNNILDYSKISNLSSAQKAERHKADSARHTSSMVGDVEEMGVSSNVDVARLTEEVVESIVSAFRLQRLSRKVESPESAGTGLRPVSTESKRVSVTVSVERQPNWTVQISPGSWTRVITNLVGNALKYTKSGYVSVKLAVFDRNSEATATDSTLVRLTVQDTGIGMSTRFLHNDAYRPFTQENSHSTGSGLGLSIVKQIATDIGAEVTIKSQLGEGTTVVFDCPMNFIRSANPGPIGLSTLTGFPAKRLHILTFPGEHKAVSEVDAFHAEECFKDIIASWLGWEVSKGSRLLASSESVVYAVFESDLFRWKSEQPQSWSEMTSTLELHSGCLLVLESSFGPPPAEPTIEDSIVPVFVHHPIGPLKLLRVFKAFERVLAILKEGENAQPSSKIDGNPPKESSTKKLIANGRPSHARTQSLFRASSDSIARSHEQSAPNNKNPRALRNPPLSESTYSTLQPKVLLVEDNQINMKILIALMEKLEIDYQTARNGLEAISAFTAHLSTITVILMDMSMPVMDGFAATAHIRNIEKTLGANRCRIVAVTGVTNAKSRQDALNAGVNKYLTKPISMSAIKEIMYDMED